MLELHESIRDEWSRLLLLFVLSMAESTTDCWESQTEDSFPFYYKLKKKKGKNKKESDLSSASFPPPIWGRPRDFMLLTPQVSLFRLSVLSTEIFVCKFGVFLEILEQKIAFIARV